MNYEKIIPFNGSIDKAFEVARNAFLPLGFRITKNTDEFMELTGPGTLWTNGQNPLVGISKIYVARTGDELLINAELGGIRNAVRFLIFFVISMSIFFVVLFGIIFNKQGTPVQRFLLPLAPFIPWPAIIPLMAIWMKSRTSSSLDVLLNNMATLAQQS
jgi:hypothetical protein